MTVRSAVVRTVAVASVAAGMMIGSAAMAGAGKPANRACVGESLSALASNQQVPGGFGAAVVGFAQDPQSPPGLGDGIQVFQAGFVDDEIVPNTCND